MYKRIRKVVIILLWMAVWQVAAVWIDNSVLLVGPAQVFFAFMENIIRPDFVRIIGCSLTRIGLGFFLALFLGLFLGAACYRLPVIGELLEPAVQFLKSVPVASFVVLLLIWFGSGKLSFWISLLVVFPNVYVNTVSGLKSADAKLLEMSQVFGLSGLNRFWYIYRPALMPYLNSCLKISLGMSWKSGVAAEVIGQPDYSLGERLYQSKIYLDTAGLFAWTLTVILLSFAFEKAVLHFVKTIGTWHTYPVPGAGRRGLRRAGPESAAERTAELAHVSKSYGDLKVLQDYSITLETGKRYLLMAPSGSGKTTLLRILTGLEHADQGKITRPCGPVGMVFQEDRLCEEYDAVCNIMLGMGKAAPDQEQRLGTEAEGISGGGRKKQIADYVRKEACLILPQDCLNKPVGELSGGMRRRVALLRAVLSDSDILILDEPFAGLDEENRVRCAEYLLARLRGRTLLATTHREEDVELLQGIVRRL